MIPSQKTGWLFSAVCLVGGASDRGGGKKKEGKKETEGEAGIVILTKLGFSTYITHRQGVDDGWWLSEIRLSLLTLLVSVESRKEDGWLVGWLVACCWMELWWRRLAGWFVGTRKKS